MLFNSRGPSALSRLFLILAICFALPAFAQQGAQQPGAPAPQAPAPAPTVPAAPASPPTDFETPRRNVETELTAARKVLHTNAALRNVADAATAALKTAVTARQADGSAVRILIEEDAQLSILLENPAVVDLTKAGTSAEAEAKTLASLQHTLVNLKNDPGYANLTGDPLAQYLQTVADGDSALKQLENDSDLDTKSASDLQSVLAQIIVQAKEVTQKWLDALAPLNTFVAPPPNDFTNLARVLGASLSPFADIASLRPDYDTKWTAVSAKLSSLIQLSTTTPVKADEVKTNLNSLQSSIPKIASALSDWFTKLKSFAMDEAAIVATDATQVAANPAAYTPSGLGEFQKATEIHDLIQAVSDAWQKLIPIAGKLGTSAQPFDPKTVATAAADMNKANQALLGAVAQLQEDISGDRSEFVADQMPLYYFTDVPRLIKMLNSAAFEIGGIQGAQAQADAAKQKLAEAELQLTAAMNAVNSYQTRLMQLPAELKQARADANSANNNYGQTANRLSGLTDQLGTATTRYNAATSAVKTTPTDRAAQLELQNSLAAKNRLATQSATAQTDNANALHDKDVADQKLKAAEDEQTGIPAQIAQAKIALEAAQNNVSQRRQESLLAAMAESDAFALARDNAPFWFAPAIGVSKDVARRVEMFGTNDSKIVYLRGRRPDLDAVISIIAGIDAPSPQARITLWSLQLNYTNDARGNSVRKLNDALNKVETALAEIRFHMAEAASLLRDSVNAKLSEVMKDSNCPNSGACRVDRIRKFYNRQVLLQLGDTDAKSDSFKELSNWTVPDPAGTTTLGEALMILSLAKPEIRSSIFTNFADSFKKQKPPSFQQTNWTDTEDPFKNLRRALDIDLSASDNQATELTSTQLEILHALESVAYRRLVTRARALSAQLGTRSNYLQSLCTQIEPINHKLRRAAPSSCADYPAPPAAPDPSDPDDILNAKRTALLTQIYAAKADLLSASGEISPLLWYVWQHFGVRPGSPELFPDQTSLANIATDAAKRDAVVAGSAAQARLDQEAITRGRAREAAADEMLKELMTAMEEDLDRDFVRPGLAQLRQDILSQGNLQVGVLQRTSVLATNRLVARVDPRASAQLALGEQEDILQSVMQLGQIFMAAQSGGVLGTFGALKNLQGQTTEPPQEIYGITTGNQFKVTPIFDPTGQALRFKFDYVAANNVLEPNGTLNPQLPRIERHTVNTEVQISNMELREISRYEANSRLGLPTKYWGGIPILKDIPYVRPVPLIGWFVRHGGSGAVSQESLLFGQTAIYPAIGEIIDLLTGTVNTGGAAPN